MQSIPSGRISKALAPQGLLKNSLQIKSQAKKEENEKILEAEKGYNKKATA